MGVDVGAIEPGYRHLASHETFSWNSDSIEVHPNQICEARSWVVGFDGALGSALLVMVFLDEMGKEVQRKITLLDDFSGRARCYTIRTPAPLRARQVLAGYRVNSDLPSDCTPAGVKMWFRVLELRVLPGIVAEGPDLLPIADAGNTVDATPECHPVFPVRAGLSEADVVEQVGRFKHWYHRVEVLPGFFTPGVNDVYPFLNRLQLPEDCAGLRVLDLGTCDGFFSFALERRGAKEVIAIDHKPVESTGFPILSNIFDSQVKFFQDNVYNLSVEKYGKFDIVLCLGLLYHLRNPLLVLDKIREICSGQLYVESHVIDSSLQDSRKPWESEGLLNTPLMQFYAGDEVAGDPTNWWGPNSACLRQMIESCNFMVLSQQAYGGRSILRCVVNDDSQRAYFREIERGLCL